LVNFISFIIFPYPFLPIPIIQQLSVHIIMSSTCTDFHIVDYHSLFLSLLPRCLKNSSTITNMFYIYACMIMFVLCICLSFESIFHI
jgi:hypothetical protein